MSKKEKTTSISSLHSIDLKNTRPNTSCSETGNIPNEGVSSAIEESSAVQHISSGCIFKFLWKVILTVISICMIAVGSMYLQQCPVGKYIPVYLLVGGLMGILKPLVSLSGIHSSSENQTVLRQALSQNSSKASSLINCFMLCWFFIGSYWIYGIYEPNYGTAGCNKILYLFSFWLITSVYLTAAVVVAIIVIVLAIKMCAVCVYATENLRSKATETPASV